MNSFKLMDINQVFIKKYISTQLADLKGNLIVLSSFTSLYRDAYPQKS